MHRHVSVLAVTCALFLVPPACSSDSSGSDGTGTGTGSGTGSGDGDGTDTGGDDGTSGGGPEPCDDASDCDDGIDCTVDDCILVLGCVHEPDDSLCGCGETCDPELGCGVHCYPAACPWDGKLYQCGNCPTDDDDDCSIDAADVDCWGPCDNNESGWKGEIPGQQENDPCNKMDCYFDADSGAGNDDCYWSQQCDPLEPGECPYEPDAQIPGTNMSCEEAQAGQSDLCLEECLPLVPNGCDCFGCCEVRVAEESCETNDDCPDVDGVFCDDGIGQCVHTVYLGTEEDGQNGSCELDAATDTAKCWPCTQVEGCLNDCEYCEICPGKPVLPPDCFDDDQCPPGVQPCGLPGQPPCPEGFYCLTGCCVDIIPEG